MSVLKEIAKNYLIRLPFVRRIAKRWHITGVNQSAAGVRTIFELYSKYAGFSGKDILELGPGHTWGVAAEMYKEGARSVTIIDIENYISAEILQAHPYINYIIYDGQVMPLEDKSADLVVSYTVFEHLRNPDTTVAETFRVLREGGMAVHWIDLGDHLHFGPDADPAMLFDCLRYTERTWNLMTNNRGCYVNRLRRSDWINSCKDAGFTILHAIPVINNSVREMYEKGGVQYLKGIRPDDRFASHLLLVLKK